MRRALLPVLLVALAGCDVLGSDDGLVCTDEFRTYTVRVVTPDGDPLPDLATSVTIPQAGTELGASGDGGTEDGVYVVADDGDASAIRGGQRTVAFSAFDTDWVAIAQFVFRFDGCHVEKVSGPDEITARSSVQA